MTNPLDDYLTVGTSGPPPAAAAPPPDTSTVNGRPAAPWEQARIRAGRERQRQESLALLRGCLCREPAGDAG